MWDNTKTTSFPKNRIRILLLEAIHENAVRLFEQEGFQVESFDRAFGEDELTEKIKDVHAIGVRSKTRLPRNVLEAGKKLMCTGSFCIGTDRVDLDAAQELGLPVFNAPFSNTRSVAEIVIAHIINLSRQTLDVSTRMHKGIWKKSAAGCFEIRGKTVGIVGYGHVGSQVSVLAEALGMRVVFFDIVPKLGLGNAQPVSGLKDLLAVSDFVTLHVPGTEDTVNLITATELEQMKKGACLINYSRGTVVDVDALAASLRSGYLGGAAVDVFPSEPDENGPGFVSPLQNCPNTILTPHVGGSTQEAQALIGTEVAQKIIDFINCGSTEGAVNFPRISMPRRLDTHHCVVNVHRNVPGVLGHINGILASVNVSKQQLETMGSIGYMLIAVDQEVSQDVMEKIKALPTSIKTRVLF